MDASNLQSGTPMESHWSLRRTDADAPITPASDPADFANVISTLVHADDLAGRAIAALGRGDLARAIGDFEWSLKFHVDAAFQCANLAGAAQTRGDAADATFLRWQGAVLFWHLPGCAQIAAMLLRAAVAGTDAQDPAESLRFIAVGALRYPETREVLNDETREQLASAVRGAFTEPSRVEVRITRVDPSPPAAISGTRPSAPPATPSVLSTREREVVCLIAEGLTNRGIGFRLGVKAITINTFVTRIFGKLGVDNRAAAAAYAVRHGLCNG